MSNPPPGLGGGGAGAVRGPPPGFGAPQTPASSGRNAGTQGEGQGGTAVIVRAQVAFYLTTLTEESFEKASVEVRAVSDRSCLDVSGTIATRPYLVCTSILLVAA